MSSCGGRTLLGTSPGSALADLELNDHAHLVTRAGNPVLLSPTEYRLLRYLLENSARVVSRGELLDQVWHRDEEEGTNVVDTYVGYLRRKIDHVDPKLLHTVRGFGYVFALAADLAGHTPGSRNTFAARPVASELRCTSSASVVR